MTCGGNSQPSQRTLAGTKSRGPTKQVRATLASASLPLLLYPCMYASDGKGCRPVSTGRIARGADIKSPPRRIDATQQAYEKLQGFFGPEKWGPLHDVAS